MGAGLMPFSSGRQPEMLLTISLFHYAQMMSVQMEHRPSKMQMNAGNLRIMGRSKALMVRSLANGIPRSRKKGGQQDAISTMMVQSISTSMQQARRTSGPLSC